VQIHGVFRKNAYPGTGAEDNELEEEKKEEERVGEKTMNRVSQRSVK
jgi:hypothetical protein